jgi:hypothetical protein
MKVANPSSQDRTPRRAIVLAVSPAAAPYRASGLVLWHKADVLKASPDVRFCEGFRMPARDGRRDSEPEAPLAVLTNPTYHFERTSWLTSSISGFDR